MRRTGLGLMVAALALTACTDVQAPAGANFQVRDGMHNPGMVPAYSYLYFLPPIVPSPTFPDGATFDSGLLPYLTVRVTDVGEADYTAGAPDAPNAALCSDQSAPLSGLSVDPLSGTYSLGWQTKKNGPDRLTLGHVYRICVWVNPPDVPGTTTPERPIGYRDVMPDDGGADQPRNTDQAPVYQFSIGSNIPVKFKVLNGLFSADLCTNYDNLGQDYDCTAQVLGSNTTAVCDAGTCTLTTGVMSEPELWLIEKWGIDNPECFNTNGTSNVDGFPLDIDIPQYAGCVRVTLFDQGATFAGFLDSYGTVGACFYPSSGPPIKTSSDEAPPPALQQDESIQMHIQYPGAGPTVYALPWGATGGIFEECELAEGQTTGTGLGAEIASAARKLWRGTQQILNPWFAPPKVYAFHTGFGGHTSFSPDEGGAGDFGFAPLVDQATGELVTMAPLSLDGQPVQVFNLAWALPSQMEPSRFCAGTDCLGLATSPLTVNLGDVVTVGVEVTDNGAFTNALGGRSLGTTGRAVEGATIRFDATDGQSDTAVSDVNGHASFAWMANAEGTTTITASGFGIGITGANGPYDAFDDTTYVDQPTPLGLGELTFTVQVCPKTPDADSVIADPTAGYYAGKTWTPVPVNLGGSSVGTAYLMVTNDCDDLYVAFMVPGDVSNTTSLRFVFDNTPVGTSIDALTFGESADDDILSMTLTGDELIFQDRYLSTACLGSKQADCGPLDARKDGSGAAGLNTFAAAFPAGGAAATTKWYVYEMKHPLKREAGDVAPFQDFDRDPGQFLGWYLALYLGNGTKANAEYPDQRGNFKNYRPYLIK